MSEFYDICGTPINLAMVKDFRIVQREYIYRPGYKENEKSITNRVLGKRFEFWGMIPYAAIVGEHGHKSDLDGYKSKDLKESVLKDVAVGTISTIADKFNIKALKYKKYRCINASGREFYTFLEDVPASVMRFDGKAYDVYKDDEQYKQLGESISPVIEVVPALVIKGKDDSYIFFGNGIQLQNVGAEYERLKAALNIIQEEKQNKKIALNIPKFSLPSKKKDEIESSEAKLLESNSVTFRLKNLKESLARSEITQEDYDKEVEKVIKEID